MRTVAPFVLAISIGWPLPALAGDPPPQPAAPAAPAAIAEQSPNPGEAERLAIVARLQALEVELKALQQRLAIYEAATAVGPSPPEDLAAAAVPVPEPEPPAAAPAPLTIASGAGGRNFLNLSLDGLLAAGASTAEDIGALQTGGHDPAQRGFTVQNVEAVFEGAVDPYFRGQANVIFQIDPNGETLVELEEVYATTTSLPRGLQVKAGQFFTEFGRLNPTHPHSWDFVDQPLVNGRFFGPDGLRSVGARLSWLLPTDFYSEAFLAVQNSQGETLNSFRSVPGESLFGREIVETRVGDVSDLLITPRYTASFDLSDTQTVLLGASTAFGPNGTGEDGRTRIYGVDGFWKWKPATAFRGFPFVKVQGELLRRSVSASAAPEQDLAAAEFEDWGGYLQLNWGYQPGRVAGFRIDRVDILEGHGADLNELGLGRRLRLSPVFTWFPTEYSKLRLQYNFDRFDALREDEHSVWLQLEFLLGAHAAHEF